MNIWLDDLDFIDIEVCAMAPYADKGDLTRINYELTVQRWEKVMQNLQDESRG
jgi:hypothetical protein